VTTSSPESEPHVEHTIRANGIRQGYTGTGGLVLSQLHIGLAVGFALVACLTAFGGGMIVGMWYKASEQSPPVGSAGTPTLAEQPAPGQETASQPREAPAPVTFYNTLTNSNVAYAPLTPPPASSSPTSAKGAGAPASAAGMTNSASAATVGSTKAAVASKATPSAARVSRTAALHEPQKHTKTTPAAKTAPAEAVASPSGTKAVAQKPMAPASQAGKETAAQRPADATALARAPGAEDVSARVQHAAAPAQGLRSRGRVSSYTERIGADQTAQHLTAQEQVPAIVAGKD
jgi:hypothetical protein